MPKFSTGVPEAIPLSEARSPAGAVRPRRALPDVELPAGIELSLERTKDTGKAGRDADLVKRGVQGWHRDVNPKTTSEPPAAVQALAVRKRTMPRAIKTT
jgi:hypothetical protein